MKMNTKSKLISSLLVLVLCVTAFAGSTYAWFTDTVTSSGNKIQAGTLKIDLQLKDGNEYASIKDSNDPIFGADALWEPGYTEWANVKVVNNGSLALKYTMNVIVNETVETKAQEFDIADVIEVWYAPSEVAKPATRDLENHLTYIGMLSDVIAQENGLVIADKLENKNDFDLATIALKMNEDAGNDYQGLTLGTTFDIRVSAAQLMAEDDSFGTDYDENAKYAYEATGTLETGKTALELPIVTVEDNKKIGSVVIPAEALAEGVDGTKKGTANVTESDYKGNFTIAAGSIAEVFDISVEGIKDGNTDPVKVTYTIAPGLDPATVKVYHYDEEITSTYDPNTGYIKFEVTEFSPFTFVYNANSVYTPPTEDESKLPKATVVRSSEYENTELDWGSYGQWSPTEGLDANLEAAYTFSCPEEHINNLDVAKENPYANWYCDFYVMLDKELGANEIFLGGNYGSFGWVGFHNGDLTLPANNEIGLLESVTTNPWTYLDVVQHVGTFICGVGHVGDELDGATFTVMLRLTNPDDASEFYNVKTINYTFPVSPETETE
ncbi:MAG: hypothetical protein IJN72_09505 [Firmicutes bacterium]|nr:hypothetical protein [Bacillota bacterium]